MESVRDYQHNLQLYQQMDQTIRDRQLYLERDLGRTRLCQLMGIDRNHFTTMMRQHCPASNLSDYLNRMRIDYAVRLMREKPHWTLQAVIESSGMTTTPFKRCFKQIYGVAPSVFREQLIGQSVNER